MIRLGISSIDIVAMRRNFYARERNETHTTSLRAVQMWFCITGSFDRSRASARYVRTTL
jgi:hypothetical protein